MNASVVLFDPRDGRRWWIVNYNIRRRVNHPHRFVDTPDGHGGLTIACVGCGKNRVAALAVSSTCWTE